VLAIKRNYQRNQIFHLQFLVYSLFKQEHACLEVENAEDDLVQKEEVAITFVKAVLDNALGSVQECVQNQF
jgi:hypothetical protein